jgi:hypothetical protein
MTEFKDCIVVKNFLDPQSVDTISRYMEYALKQGGMYLEEEKEVRSYARYADPLIETILQNSLPHVQEITGKKLFPTYSFARVYLNSDFLAPHIDRPPCEYSVTVNVAGIGKPWPIYMKPRGKEPIAFYLDPGDAVVYKGCEVVHWREKADGTEVTAQFMLHYVDQNGPHADFKLDKRASLGAPLT